jgi:transcriptional regulator with XRE-family HTH domain
VPKSIHSPEQEHLTALLRQLRLDSGLRQVDLAERLGRPQSYVSKYETGERRLDLIELRAICEAVGSSLGDLVTLFEGKR